MGRLQTRSISLVLQVQHELDRAFQACDHHFESPSAVSAIDPGRVLALASILGVAASVAGSYGQGVVRLGNYNGIPVTWGGTRPPYPAGVQSGAPDRDNGLVIGLYARKGIITNSSALILVCTAPLFSGTTETVGR
jgi:hypothetical protein